MPPRANNAPIIAEGQPVMFRDLTVWRDPSSFPDSYLWEIDFDETCFTTFISNNDGVAVHEAYKSAVGTVLGEEALEDFSLDNRAPTDVIEKLLNDKPYLIQNALTHAHDFFAQPDDVTDIGLGMIARFASRGLPVHDELTTRAITEMLVIRKKDILIPKIGYDWPNEVPGFIKAWSELNHKKRTEEKWEHVHLAIVSSGHTDFIKKVMETAGVDQPDVYMTDDEMRRQVTPKTKPHPYALQLVRNAWFNAYVVPRSQQRNRDFLAATKQRQAYIGDDANKDGKMAERDGVAFMLHDGRPDTWQKIGERIVHAVETGEYIGDLR